MISRVEVSIDDVDNDCLLERSLVAFLVESDAKALDSGRCLPRKKAPRFILCADMVVFRAV